MAPRHPRKPVTMTMAPMAMTMLAAEREGKEGENVAKLPWDTDSQIPTPSSPQPHNCRRKQQIMRYWCIQEHRFSQKAVVLKNNTHYAPQTKINWNVALSKLTEVQWKKKNNQLNNTVYLVQFSMPIGSTRGRTHHANFVPWWPNCHWWKPDCPLTFVFRQESSCVTALAYL